MSASAEDAGEDFMRALNAIDEEEEEGEQEDG